MTDAKKVTELKFKFQQHGWNIETEHNDDIVTVYGTHGKKHPKLFIYKKEGDNYGQN